jgi:malonate decarboxylase gamma subunit
MENLLGQGRAAIDLIVDENSFEENALADLKLPYEITDRGRRRQRPH